MSYSIVNLAILDLPSKSLVVLGNATIHKELVSEIIGWYGTAKVNIHTAPSAKLFGIDRRLGDRDTT